MVTALLRDLPLRLRLDLAYEGYWRMSLTRPSLLFRLRSSSCSDDWKEFARIYEEVLVDYARPYGHCEQDQKDIIQNVWVILCRLMPKFDYRPKEGGFRRLLKRIVKNSAIDWFRRQGPVRVNSEIMSEVRAGEPCPEDSSPRRQSILDSVLIEVRRKCHPTSWACFEQHVLQRQLARDVGSSLGVSPNAVYVNASRVLDRVRAQCIETEAQRKVVTHE